MINFQKNLKNNFNPVLTQKLNKIIKTLFENIRPFFPSVDTLLKKPAQKMEFRFL